MPKKSIYRASITDHRFILYVYCVPDSTRWGIRNGSGTGRGRYRRAVINRVGPHARPRVDSRSTHSVIGDGNDALAVEGVLRSFGWFHDQAEGSTR